MQLETRGLQSRTIQRCNYENNSAMKVDFISVKL